MSEDHVNRETWAASLHLNNDEWLYETARQAVRQAVRQGNNTGEALESFYEELLDDARDGHYGTPAPEIITRMEREVGSAWRVDWQHVADSLMS